MISDSFNKSIINKNSAIPLYYQLYTYLVDLIEKETIKNGDYLPTEEELCELLEISRPTIRQAYNKLENEGYIKRQRSKGTIVNKTKVFGNFLNRITTFYDEVNSKSEQVRTKVVKIEITDSFDEAQEVLGVKKLIHLIRVRYIDQTPIVYIDSYIPYEEFKELLMVDFENNSLYDQMNRLGNTVTNLSRTIRAIKAHKNLTEYLNVSVNDPIIYSTTIGRNSEGKAIEYSLAQYDGNLAKFEISIEK